MPEQCDDGELISEQRARALSSVSGRSSSRSATETAEMLYKTSALVMHRVRCGKPTCRCSMGEGHGPYWFLYWREGMRQRRCYVKPGELETVRKTVERRRAADLAERQARALALADLREVDAWLRTLRSR